MNVGDLIRFYKYTWAFIEYSKNTLMIDSNMIKDGLVNYIPIIPFSSIEV